MASTNRKNPLFYSVTKASVSLGDNATATVERDLAGRKEDEKFNEFKKNLLEELKVLKEANNLMRERTRLGLKPQKQPENRWLKEFLEKRNGRSGNPIAPTEVDVTTTTTTVKSKDFLRQELAGNNRRLVENYLERTKYDAGLRNIYSSPNNQRFRNGQTSSQEKEKPISTEEWGLDSISTKLDFNIKGFLRDLGVFVKTSRREEILKVNIKEYMGKACKIEFLGAKNESQTQNSQIENAQIKPYHDQKPISRPRNLEEEDKVELEPKTNNQQEKRADSSAKTQEENKADSLQPTKENHIQDDIPTPSSEQEESKTTLPQNDSEFLTQKAVTSCLSSLYDQAIHKVKHLKKKNRKTENVNNDTGEQENNNEETEHDAGEQKEDNQQLISSTLNALYNTAITQQTKKKSIKTHHQCEKKVAEHYLEGLYENVVRNKKNLCLDLGEVTFKEVDKFDSCERVILGSLKTLRENAVWLYFKTRVQYTET